MIVVPFDGSSFDFRIRRNKVSAALLLSFSTINVSLGAQKS